MSDWWKNPVLHGPENDYGDYDYLIEEIPQDYAKWELSRDTSRCDSCGKERHLVFRSEHYFHTLDGYDYMSYTDCWKCRLRDKIHSIQWKFKKRIKALKTARELYQISRKHTWNWKKCYDMALKFEH
jgi:hypothetical protein